MKHLRNGSRWTRPSVVGGVIIGKSKRFKGMRQQERIAAMKHKGKHKDLDLGKAGKNNWNLK